MAVRLAQAVRSNGEVLLAHWLPVATGAVLEAASTPPPVRGPPRKKLGLHPAEKKAPEPPKKAPPHSELVKHPIPVLVVDGKVNAQSAMLSLDSVLDIVGQPPFQRLGLNAILNGSANATWGHGDVNTLVVNSTLSLSPGEGALANEAPTNGTIDATYVQKTGTVDLRALNIQLPGSRLNASGRLGAYPLDSPTALNVDFASTNLDEFDTVLRDLGLQRNGRLGNRGITRCPERRS